MKLMTFNAQTGVGMTDGNWLGLMKAGIGYVLPRSNLKLVEFGRKVRDEGIDILTLTEVEGSSLRNLGRTQLQIIREETGLRYGAFFPVNQWPLNVIDQGHGIISRWPIVDTEVYGLPGGIERRSLVRSVVDVEGREIEIYIAHLSLGSRSRRARLNKIADILGNSRRPFVLTGDFNTWRKEEMGEGLKSLDLQITSHMTYPSWKPVRAVDYIIPSNTFSVVESKVLSEKIFSDHLPLVYEMNLG